MFRFIFLLFFSLTTMLVNAQSVDSLLIGSGGGFTGQVTVYKIIKKKAYKGKGLEKIKYSEEASLKCKGKRNVKKGMKNILKNSAFNHPSNTYQFITVYSKGVKTEFIWGDPSFQVPKEIQEYYERNSKIIASLKFTSK